MRIWKRTVHSLVWGTLNDKLEPLPPDPNKPNGGPPNPGNCNATPFTNGLNLVKIPVNPFYSLLTVGTTGFWSPMQVQWQCAVYQPAEVSHVPQ